MRLSGFRVMVVVMALAAPAFAEGLTLPAEGLESRIEFWKKVFTQYGEDDVIIHDRIHVNLIYDIATRADQAAKIAAVRQALDEIRGNLATPENLSVTAQQIQSVMSSEDIPMSTESLADVPDHT